MVNIFEILDTNEARFNYMKGLVYMVKADKIIQDDEVCFLKNAMIGLGLSGESISLLEELLNKKEYLVEDIEFDNKKKKMFFLREALQICYIDNDYSDAERLVVDKIADQLGIPSENIQKIEEWVSLISELNKRGEELLDL